MVGDKFFNPRPPYQDAAYCSRVYLSQKVVQGPKRVCDLGGHCGRPANRRMATAKVVMGDVQRNRGREVLQLLAEAKRKPGETAHERADGQVAPFNVRGAYRRFVVYALDGTPIRTRKLGRRVAAGLIAFEVVLNQDAILDRVREREVNGIGIWRESIGRNLRLVNRLMVVFGDGFRRDNPLRKIHHEGFRDFAVALADSERRNQLGIFIQRDVQVLIADRRGILARLNAALLLFYKCPNFIALKVPELQAHQLFVEQVAALVADADHQTHDRIAVDAGKPLYGADAISFDQQVDNGSLRFIAQHVHGNCPSGWGRLR